jgi:hypothetical protein
MIQHDGIGRRAGLLLAALALAATGLPYGVHVSCTHAGEAHGQAEPCLVCLHLEASPTAPVVAWSPPAPTIAWLTVPLAACEPGCPPRAVSTSRAPPGTRPASI